MRLDLASCQRLGRQSVPGLAVGARDCGRCLESWSPLSPATSAACPFPTLTEGPAHPRGAGPVLDLDHPPLTSNSELMRIPERLVRVPHASGVWMVQLDILVVRL